jgi:hypothetical protein
MVEAGLFAAIAIAFAYLAITNHAQRNRNLSERDRHSAESKMVYNSPEWVAAEAEDISVRIVAVLQKPAPQLSWINERQMLQLTPDEKKIIENVGVKGQMEVVSSDGRGSGSKEVRVVIIQSGPLAADARLIVPRNGSAIYLQDGGKLEPLWTNSTPSALQLEIYHLKSSTAFFLDYPRDQTRYGGDIISWNTNGTYHRLGERAQ